MTQFSQQDLWVFSPAKKIDEKRIEEAVDYQNTLTKPQGSLGVLENIATQFCGYQNTLKPRLEKPCVRVFAGDHGVCAQGVSAFPQEVTTQMIENFVRGGAAISVLSNAFDADFSVVNMGVANPLISREGVVDISVGPGTQDFSQHPAMTEGQCLRSLQAGKDCVGVGDIFIGGEMGIGNTSAASAIYSVLLDMPVADSVGPGTGLNPDGVSHKQKVIEQAVLLHGRHLTSPLKVLQYLGGFEICALSGAYIHCAQIGIPVLVDGFISTAAALVAQKINPSIKPWLLFSHQSAEPAHKLAIEHLNVKPLLNLGMRLGEGSGAAVALSTIQSALLLHNNMATFDQAGVNEGEEGCK